MLFFKSLFSSTSSFACLAGFCLTRITRIYTDSFFIEPPIFTNLHECLRMKTLGFPFKLSLCL